MAESQQIEILTWGRGIHRIFEACHDSGTPEPKLSLSGHDLWTEFPFSEQYLAALNEKAGEKTEKPSEKTPEKTTQETTQEKILAILRDKPTTTRKALATALGLSDSGVKYHLNKLRTAKMIRHVGSTKAGHWEVLEG